MSGCNTPATLPPPTPPSDDTISIGILAPTSGEMTTFGRWLQNGILMAFEAWNERGGLHGQRITWHIYDSRCDFVAASEATKQAIADGMALLIGPLCTEAAIGAATAADAAHMLLLTPTATHPLVTVDGQGETRPTIFRAAAEHRWQGQQAARFAVEDLHRQRAAIWQVIGEDDGAYMAEAFAAQFQEQGGTVAYQAAINPAWLADHITATLAAQVDVLYLPIEPNLAYQVAATMPETVTLLGGPRWEGSDLNRTALTGAYFTTHYVATPTAWTEHYKALYAIEPETLAFLGYEAAEMLLQASEQAGTVDPDAVSAVLMTAQFQGLTGAVSFDAYHNPQRSVPALRIEPEGVVLERMIAP